MHSTKVHVVHTVYTQIHACIPIHPLFWFERLYIVSQPRQPYTQSRSSATIINIEINSTISLSLYGWFYYERFGMFATYIHAFTNSCVQKRAQPKPKRAHVSYANVRVTEGMRLMEWESERASWVSE